MSTCFSQEGEKPCKKVQSWKSGEQAESYQDQNGDLSSIFLQQDMQQAHQLFSK